MSDRERVLLARLEADPDIRTIAPVLKVLVGIPDDTLAEFLRLADLWIRLGGVRRAMLVLTLDHDLNVVEVARLAGVHRCTLSRNESFKNLHKMIRSGRLEALPRGSKSADGDIDSFLDGDDDDAPDARD